MRLLESVVGLFVLGVTACGTEAPLSAEEARELGFATAEQELSVELSAPVTLAEGSLSNVDLGVEMDNEEFDFDVQNQNKCSPEKQKVCDQCMSTCDELCPISNDGSVPRSCMACKRSCSKSCSKCTSAF